MTDIDFKDLPPVDRAREIAVSRLMKHFRGLERAGLMPESEASKFIGSVKILEAQAKGTFTPKV